jgi:hypothetical protein
MMRAAELAMALSACASPALRQGPQALAPLPASVGETAILNGRLIHDMDAATVLGEGPYRYRFVLLDVSRRAPAANRAYALSNREHHLPFVAEEKQVYQGLTDAYGRTDVFAFGVALPPDSWFLRERFGAGPFGEQMRLVDAEDEPIAGMAYALLICDASPRYHYGLTDADGNTGYAATATLATIILSLRGEDHGGDGDGELARAREECQSSL